MYTFNDAFAISSMKGVSELGCITIRNIEAISNFSTTTKNPTLSIEDDSKKKHFKHSYLNSDEMSF